MICPICRNNNISSIYKGHLRSGSFGKKSTLKYNVYSYNTCSSKYIENILNKEYYKLIPYKQNYNNIEIETFYKGSKASGMNKINLFNEKFNFMYKKSLDKIYKIINIWIKVKK